MDMHVNTNAFLNASSSLKKHCDIIEAMTGILLKRLENAKQGFDDVNYDRTVESATSIKKRIAVFSREVNSLNRDLQTLESFVDDYANGGYGR